MIFIFQGGPTVKEFGIIVLLGQVWVLREKERRKKKKIKIKSHLAKKNTLVKKDNFQLFFERIHLS